MNNQNCNNCIHFYITYKSKFPYGCRAFGVISKKHRIWRLKNFLAQIVHYFQENKKVLKYLIKEELHDTTTKCNAREHKNCFRCC